jgi:hypothetical protein
MPISITDSQAPDRILVVVAGETSMQEMMSFIAEHRAGTERAFAFLFDVSDASMDVSGDEMRQVAAFAAKEARKAPMGPAEGRRTVGVFRTLADAHAWLDSLKT